MRKKILMVTMGLMLAVTPCIPAVTSSLSIEAATQCGEWSANRVYNTGDVVSYQGEYWEAQWYTQNEVPGTTGQWGVWQKYSGAVTPTQAPTATPAPTSGQTGTYAAWNANTVYNTGDIVSYGGKNWKAGWYTIGDVPGTTGQWGVWQEVAGTVTPTAQPTQQPTENPWQPTPTPTQIVTPQPTQPGSNIPSDPQSYMNKIKVATSCPDNILQRQAGVDYGTVIKKQYYSTTCQKTRACNVILPANYSTSKKYPVLYYLHGIMGSEDSMLGQDGTIEIPANLAKQGKAKEMIIVLPNEYAPAPGTEVPAAMNQAYFDGYDNFINDLANDLMPFIEKTYSVATGRENTAICGFSMGGRNALYIGYAKPELFGYVAGFAPAPGVTPGQDYSGSHKGLFSESEFRIKNPAYTPYVTIISGGTADGVVGTFPKSYHDILTRNNQPHVWIEIPGGGHGGTTVSAGYYNFVSSAFGILN